MRRTVCGAKNGKALWSLFSRFSVQALAGYVNILLLSVGLQSVHSHSSVYRRHVCSCVSAEMPMPIFSDDSDILKHLLSPAFVFCVVSRRLLKEQNKIPDRKVLD